MRRDDEPLLGEIGHHASLEIVQIADVLGLATPSDVQLSREDLDFLGTSESSVIVKGVYHLPEIPGVCRSLVLRRQSAAVEQEADAVG